MNSEVQQIIKTFDDIDRIRPKAERSLVEEMQVRKRSNCVGIILALNDTLFHRSYHFLRGRIFSWIFQKGSEFGYQEKIEEIKRLQSIFIEKHPEFRGYKGSFSEAIFTSYEKTYKLLPEIKSQCGGLTEKDIQNFQVLEQFVESYKLLQDDLTKSRVEQFFNIWIILLK